MEERQRPSRIEWLDIFTRKATVFRPTSGKHNLSDLVFRDVTVTSRDGTNVPMTLIHQPGIALDGTNRTLLYAYGGFGISMWPGYNEFVAAWVRLGGVYAMAAIRGGGEFGQPWHDGGRLANKQNSFDDFIASSEWLIANGYTKPERLGITGASNGGLLVLVLHAAAARALWRGGCRRAGCRHAAVSAIHLRQQLDVRIRRPEQGS